MCKKILLAVVFASTAMGCGQAREDQTSQSRRSLSFSAGQSHKPTKDGRSNGTPMPCPSVRASYEPNQERQLTLPAEPTLLPSSLVDRAPVSVTQSKQVVADGLSYETFIPRPTKKGYYEPKIVPYPVGKPVFVNGYYRKNGTYIPPHFRSLPRR